MKESTNIIEVTDILEVEKYLDGIEGAIFDLDDTLYSEKEYVRSGFQAIAKRFPKVEHMAEKLWSVFKTGGKAIDEVFEAEDMLNQKDIALRIYRLQEPVIHLYEGVSDMLLRIKESGKKIGLITDGRPEGQRSKIKALGLNIDYVIITDELGGMTFRKPNETSYILMQRKMSIPFSQMAYIGDNMKKDFIVPQKMKMRCIWFKNTDGLYYKGE